MGGGDSVNEGFPTGKEVILQERHFSEEVRPTQ